jgi:hypothetical protein
VYPAELQAWTAAQRPVQRCTTCCSGLLLRRGGKGLLVLAWLLGWGVVRVMPVSCCLYVSCCVLYHASVVYCCFVSMPQVFDERALLMLRPVYITLLYSYVYFCK